MTTRRPHGGANVEEHPKGSGQYRVRARIGRKLVTVASKLAEKQAIAIADQYKELRDEGEVRRGITVDQFGQGFLQRRTQRKLRSVPKDRNRWKNQIEADPIGRIALASLRRSDVVEWRDRMMAHGLAAQSVKNAINLLRVALGEALDRELVTENVARDVKLPRGWGATTEEDLSGIMLPAEQYALLGAVPEEHRDLVIVALFTGLRWAELSYLKPEDVQGEELLVRRSTGGGPTKRGKPRRVPLLPPAKEAIDRRLALLNKSAKWVFASNRSGVPRVNRPRAWISWVTAAKIDRRIRWHDLRHTCATSLLAGWWSPDGYRWTLDEVCRMLGHSSTQVTERYAKKLDETLFAAAARMKFPDGNRSGGSGGKHSDAFAFLNRRSQVRVLSGAPRKTCSIRDLVAAEPGTVREHSHPAISRAIRGSTARTAEGVFARRLADAYDAAHTSDKKRRRDTLRKATRALARCEASPARGAR